eukprot:Nitzschia sp. Nitz4//scaffold30_size153850//74872//75606//NITZ4_002780-RA/size153850-processed-gene-0.43-mRNA-1//-1//CDS//3329547270//5299//frame0
MMANQAAQLIDEGHYSLAASELTTALSLNKQALSSAINNSNSTPDLPGFSKRTPTPISISNPSLNLLRQVCSASDLNKKCVCMDDASNDGSDCSYVYRKTLYLPTDLRCTETPFEVFMTFSVVIMFNLALCYHLSAMNKNEDTERRDSLYKASSLYTLHHQMLTKAQDFDSKMMLLLASVNNLGHVKSLLGDSDSGNECFQWMLNTLLLLNTSKWAQRNNVSLEGFFQNTSHLVLRASNTAQAA